MSRSPNEFKKYFELPNPGLRTYFATVREGQPNVYRTNFYGKGTPIQTVAKMWSKHLAALAEDWPTLYAYEEDQRSKIGPMSVMKPLSERMQDIDQYYEAISKPQLPVDERAINAAQIEWKVASRMRHRSTQNTVAAMKKSTNSGSPYFTKRRNVTHKTVPSEVYWKDDTVYQELFPVHKTYNACAILGWRGQEGGPKPSDTKQRVVWMFPYAVNVAELQVYQPMIETFQRFNLIPAWVGMDSVDRVITKMFDTKSPKDLVVCTDFSAFDQHFNSVCQDVAKRQLEYLFQYDVAFPSWIKNVFPIKYMIPLTYDYGKIRYGRHGMASGSGGTNADETLLHRTIQHEAAILHGAQLNPNSQCLGDDGVLTYPGITAEDVMGTYTSHGLDMNESKQYVSTQDCTYLRRWHHTNYRKDGVCVGVYPTFRALGRLCEQERYYDPEVWGKEQVALRQLSIVENCKWHPLREEFLDFCIKGDKFRMGLDIPGFLDNVDSIAQRSIEQMPDFLGYTKSLQLEGRDKRNYGLSSWWVVNALKSKR